MQTAIDPQNLELNAARLCTERSTSEFHYPELIEDTTYLSCALNEILPDGPTIDQIEHGGPIIIDHISHDHVSFHSNRARDEDGSSLNLPLIGKTRHVVTDHGSTGAIGFNQVQSSWPDQSWDVRIAVEE